MNDLNELITINKLEQALYMLHEVKEIDEIKQIIDQSEALRNYAKAQQLSTEIQQDITEYNLYAIRQMGIISKGLVKFKNQYASPEFGQAKTKVLSDAGIDRRRAAEAEKFAYISEKEFSDIIAAKRKNDILSKYEVAREIKNKIIREQRNNIITTIPEELTSTYNVILADPPWQYDFSASENRSPENYYPTMTTEELYNLYIPAEDNSILFLWSPASQLQNALQMMNSWGFIYKTSAVWDKEIIGMGYYFRNRHEIILIGVKGEFRPPLPENRPSSVYQEKRTKYTKKPDYYYDIIEKMYPNGKYLELFARQQYNDKWTAWGNQIEINKDRD
ncbi:MAG: MT-A70 family methyltransferase [Oscillospiraceae bacterium]|nr:MT-A70 family methyltransferase [Oscillospiraceae bacterium]